MSTHYIHGEEVHFGHDTEDAQNLFRHEENKNEVQRHLGEAEKNGQSHFYIGEHKYQVIKKEGEDGKKVTSVERIHH